MYFKNVLYLAQFSLPAIRLNLINFRNKNPFNKYLVSAINLNLKYCVLCNFQALHKKKTIKSFFCIPSDRAILKHNINHSTLIIVITPSTSPSTGFLSFHKSCTIQNPFPARFYCFTEIPSSLSKLVLI